MKKLLALLLALAVLLSLAACGKSAQKPEGTAAPGNSQPAATDGNPKPDDTNAPSVETTPKPNDAAAGEFRTLADFYDLVSDFSDAVDTATTALVDESYDHGKTTTSFVSISAFLYLNGFLFASSFDEPSVFETKAVDDTTMMALKILASDDVAVTVEDVILTMTYTSSSGKAVRVVFEYDFDGKMMRFTQYEDEELVGWVEVVSLGGSKWAIQDRRTRAIVEYENKLCTSYLIACYFDGAWGAPDCANTLEESIYKNAAPDNAWVTAHEGDKFINRCYDMTDPNVLIISGLNCYNDEYTEYETKRIER